MMAHKSRNAFGDGNSDENFPGKFKSENVPPHISDENFPGKFSASHHY
jgi:hypothetical protein